MFFAVARLAKQYIFSGDTAVHGIQRFVTIRAAEAQLVILAASRSLNHFGKIDVLSAYWTCRRDHNTHAGVHGTGAGP